MAESNKGIVFVLTASSVFQYLTQKSFPSQPHRATLSIFKPIVFWLLFSLFFCWFFCLQTVPILLLPHFCSLLGQSPYVFSEPLQLPLKPRCVAVPPRRISRLPQPTYITKFNRLLPCTSSVMQLLTCIPFLQGGFSQPHCYIFPFEPVQVNCQRYQRKSNWGIEAAVPKTSKPGFGKRCSRTRTPQPHSTKHQTAQVHPTDARFSAFYGTMFTTN